MFINLPYLANAPRASNCGATVHKRLRAKANKASSTAAGVFLPDSGWPVVRSRRAKSKVAKPHITSSNLARLMKTIDKPTEAAVMQMMASLKLMVLLCKMVAKAVW